MDDLDDDIPCCRFIVIIGRTSTGYGAYVPDLDGCVAAGKTVEHTKHLIEEAIELHMELMHQSGEKIPEPRQSIEFVIDPEAGEEFCTWVEVDVPQSVTTT